MRRKIVIALIVIAALLLVFAGVVAMQPAEYHVERTATIDAPPAEVFEHVNDFRRWDAWSPWAKLDPNAKNSFEGPSSGEGAIFRWDGNDDVGAGSMTILDSKPNEHIDMRLDFIRPFEDTANVAFEFQPEADQTVVTWSMDGKNNFIGKAFCMFMDMDAMIGADYEKGLAAIKSLVESAPDKTDAMSTADVSESSAAETEEPSVESQNTDADESQPREPES